MPIDYKEYPKDWPQIRDRILARAGNRCEGSPKYPDCRAENHKPHPVTRSKVVLTIAHLNHDKSNHEVKDEELRAWCNRCHLTYDAKHHAANRKYGRNHKNENQTKLFPSEDVNKISTKTGSTFHC